MNLFWIYLKKLIKRAFSGMFLIIDTVGLIALALHLTVPPVPQTIFITIFVFVIFASSFSIWRESRTIVVELEKRLADIADAAPNYSIKIAKLSTGYSISEKVKEAEGELARAKSEKSYTPRGIDWFLDRGESVHERISRLTE